MNWKITGLSQFSSRTGIEDTKTIIANFIDIY